MSTRKDSYNHAHRDKYICPLCNMGEGHEKRPYNRKLDTDGNSRTPASSSPSHNKTKEYMGVFRRPTVFDKHINELHEKIFRSINSNEYICALCPCSTIAYGSLHCTTRFRGGRQPFLDHLKDHHAQSPGDLHCYPHACCPQNTASYTNARIRKTAKFFFD
jgi:hypothetical protein